MRSNGWLIVIFMVLCLGVATKAQTSAVRPLVLQVTNGGYISFKSETSSNDSQATAGSQSLASLIYSQALTDENRIIHRVLTDADQRVIFGYDLWVRSDPLTKKFSLAVLPADEAFRRTFLKQSNPRMNELFATFPTSTKPQSLDDGDAVSLELLVNEKSGVKIFDVVRVTFDRSTLIEKTFESPPKDFTLDAVSLAIKNYELFIDGELVGKGRSTIGCAGSLLWFYIPDHSRFIFSLVPRDGYSFQKIGVIDGNRIEFVLNGQHYEWISSAAILPNGGTWNLWVLEDPGYTPLFGTAKKTPKGNGLPSVLQRIDEVTGFRPALAPRSPDIVVKPPLNKTVEVPQRVMIGGADSMDHLLPKNP